MEALLKYIFLTQTNPICVALCKWCKLSNGNHYTLNFHFFQRPKFLSPSKPNSHGKNTPIIQRRGTPTGLKKQISLRTKLFEKSKSSSNIRSDQFEEEDLSTHHSLIELDIVESQNESDLNQERKRHLSAL